MFSKNILIALFCGTANASYPCAVNSNQGCCTGTLTLGEPTNTNTGLCYVYAPTQECVYTIYCDGAYCNWGFCNLNGGECGSSLNIIQPPIAITVEGCGGEQNRNLTSW
jgi:hypothetical protein